MSVGAASLTDDPAALKAMVLRLQGELRARDLLIESLRVRILRLRRQKHGASSEKIAREIEQLELVLEGVQIADAEASDAPVDESDEADAPAEAERSKTPRRKARVSEPDSKLLQLKASLAIRRESMRMLAMTVQAVALWIVLSQSLARRRHRPSHASVRSTTQRRGRTRKSTPTPRPAVSMR
jgi:plasmid stability protein